MPFAIELLLDSTASEAVRHVWRDLALTRLVPMDETIARPHVTLIAADEVDRSRLDRFLQDFAARTRPLVVRFASFGIFPNSPAVPVSSGVVFLAPVVTRSLVELHRRFCQEVGAFVTHPREYYRPDHWVPHCTLAMDLSPDAIAPTFEVCRDLALPLDASLVEIDLIEFRPVRHLASFPLAGS